MKIYICDTEELLDVELFERCYHMVSVQRREKIDKYKNEASKRQSLAAGILLEKAIAEWSPLQGGSPLHRGGVLDDSEDPDRTICYGQHGKPYLKDYPEVHFNLSHTKGRAMCVISDGPVGCDVEGIEELRINIAEHFFAREEYEYLLGISDEQKRTDEFFKLWTLKESFVKLSGEGIYCPFDSFRFDIAEEGRIILSCRDEAGRKEEGGEWTEDGERYSFCTFSEKGFRYSLAVENNRNNGEDISCFKTDILRKNCFRYNISADELIPMEITAQKKLELDMQ